MEIREEKVLTEITALINSEDENKKLFKKNHLMKAK